jgi:hypothetical protein
MQFGRSLIVATALFVSAALPAMATTSHAHRRPVSAKSHARHRSAHVEAVARPRGISDDRALEIQNALIAKGYMTGEASGHWDASSEAAMQKLQADNGWQTKLIPDSRALIKLGLGPKADDAGGAGADLGSELNIQ